MKFLSSSALLLLLNNIRSTYGQTRTFIDDAGITHTSSTPAPTIMCSARTALSFDHQFKMKPNLYAGTYGNYFPRGSIGEIDDPNYQPYWPTDPTKHELDFLIAIPTFSPTCFQSKDLKCDEIDTDAAIAAKPDHWVYMGNGYWNTGDDMKKIVDAMGTPPIFISTHYEGNTNPGCITYDPSTATYTTDESKCTVRSLLDVIKRTNEVGTFLNVPKIDLTKDQKEFCEHAELLTREGAIARTKGIRVMAVNPSIGTDESVTLYPVSPLTDPLLRSYEELGVPMLHPGKHPSSMVGAERIPSGEWFTDCAPGSTTFQNCNKNAYYPVDVWLVEGRRFFFDTPEERSFLASTFPDKGLLANQIDHWPMNDGPISYTQGARSFRQMQITLSTAIRQYDATQCVIADVTSTAFLNGAYGGLSGGDYACFNEEYLQSDYSMCSIDDLKQGKLMVTTDKNGVQTQSSTVFEPQQNVASNYVPEKTIEKQTQNSMWTEDSQFRTEEKTFIALTGLIVLLVLILFFAVTGVTVYFVCWKNKESFGAEKLQTKQTESEEDISAADKPALPDLA